MLLIVLKVSHQFLCRVESDPVTSFSVSARVFSCLLWSLSLGNFTHLTCSFLTQGINWAPSVGYLGQIKSVVERVLFAMPQSLWCAKWHQHLQQSSLNLFGIGKYFFNLSPAEPNQILAGRIKFKLASVLETKVMLCILFKKRKRKKEKKKWTVKVLKKNKCKFFMYMNKYSGSVSEMWLPVVYFGIFLSASGSVPFGGTFQIDVR